jgi:hypothetical protein
MSTETIFISVAAYQDDLLKATIADALAKAKYPNRITFGVVEQREQARRINPGLLARKYIRYIGVEPEDSRGVCWARALAMSLYQGEDWYFQIDSHMLFDMHWDEWFIGQAKALEEQCGKPIISGYPKKFWFEKSLPIREIEDGAKVHVFKPPVKFCDDALILMVAAQTEPIKKPVKAWYTAAGCLFSRGKFVDEIPYDPQIYFEGEEQTITLRSFTHGWDIFYVPNMPIYHNWDRDHRVAHWECHADKKRHENWEKLKLHSLKRVRQVLTGDLKGIYGLGNQRTIADYAAFCGIDYKAETINQDVYREHLAKE